MVRNHTIYLRGIKDYVSQEVEIDCFVNKHVLIIFYA